MEKGFNVSIEIMIILKNPTDLQIFRRVMQWPFNPFTAVKQAVRLTAGDKDGLFDAYIDSVYWNEKSDTYFVRTKTHLDDRSIYEKVLSNIMNDSRYQVF